MKQITLSFSLAVIILSQGFAQEVIHTGNSEIQGDLKVTGGFSAVGSLAIPIDNSGFGASPLFGLYYFKSMDDHPLRTRMGINYALNTNNGITQYVINGSLKAPLIELDAQAGSISLFGENGTGANLRNPNNTLNIGVHVAGNGNVGIGTTSPDVGLAVNRKTMVLGASSITGSYSDNTSVMEIISDQASYLSMKGANGSKLFISAKEDFGGNSIFSVGTPFSISTVGNGSPNTVFYSTLDGNVGIGTTEPTEKLSVKGNIRTKEIFVEAAPWPDYVFEGSYELMSLEEVNSFISKQGHLPNMPSAEEVAEDGIAVGEMNAKLLEKIEELTLHLIEQQSQIKSQQKLIDQLFERIDN